MSDRLHEPDPRHDAITIPTFWVALALSILIHLAVLFGWVPRIPRGSLETTERGEARGPLVVQLAPRPRPPPAPPPSAAAQPQPAPARPAPAPRPPPRPSAPPVIALNRPAPSIAPLPPLAPPTPPRPPADNDLASYIEARRRARESTPAVSQSSLSSPPSVEKEESEDERRKRIVAANLGNDRAPSFGRDPGGGIFQIQRMGYDEAEFTFFGWNKDVRRRTSQAIEVRKGDNSDMRIAVIRRMIAIIREHERGDFVWESRRLGREITLSARPGDNAGLEDFLMREFFADARQQP